MAVISGWAVAMAILRVHLTKATGLKPEWLVMQDNFWPSG